MNKINRDPFARPVPIKKESLDLGGESTDKDDTYTPPDIMDANVQPNGITHMDEILDEMAVKPKAEEPTVTEVTGAKEPESLKPADKPKFTPEELKPIIDSVLRRGYAAISFRMSNLEVILRSHYTWEDNMVMKLLDDESKDINLNLSMDFKRQLYSLAASLVVYDGQKFPPLAHGTKEELQKSMDDRIKCILEWPNLVFSYVLEKNAEFGMKMAAIAEDFDGIIKNF